VHTLRSACALVLDDRDAVGHFLDFIRPLTDQRKRTHNTEIE
jgi:hypothetical protein